MAGEDLTTLLDDDDLPPRPYFTTAIDSHVVVGDRNWLLIGRTARTAGASTRPRRRTTTERDTTTCESTRPASRRKRPCAAIAMAGGTLPEFGDDGALRPPRERATRTVADDGIPNDFDAVDNEHPDDFDHARRSTSTGATRRTAREDAGAQKPAAEWLYAQVAESSA